MTIWLLNSTHHVEEIKVIKSCGLPGISEGSDSTFHDVKVKEYYHYAALPHFIHKINYNGICTTSYLNTA